MKLLMVSTNRERAPMPVVPVGACLAAEAASGGGHQVDFLDLMFQRDPVRALKRAIAESQAGAIAFSVRNIDNNDMRNPKVFAEDLPPMIDATRSVTSAPVILGGSAVSIAPEKYLDYTGADFAISGDAEPALRLLIESISENRPPECVPALFRRVNGSIRKNEIAYNVSGGLCLFPDYKRWIDLNAYRSSLTTLPIKTKTGCGFKCVYCTYDKVDGGRSSLAPPDMVADAVRECVSLGYEDIEFVDNVFNYPYSHAMSICETIERSRVRARLHTLEMNPKYLDDPLLDAMERAGFEGIGVTVESVADPVLSRLKKGFTAAHVREAARVVARHNIPCLWFFMLGGPGETRDSVEETLAFARDFIRPGDSAYFTHGICVYPGTALETIAMEEGTLKKHNDSFKPSFYLSPDVDPEWTRKRMKDVVRERPNFVIAGETTIPMMPFIYRIGYAIGVRPPLWRYARLLTRARGLIEIVDILRTRLKIKVA